MHVFYVCLSLHVPYNIQMPVVLFVFYNIHPLKAS